MTILCSCCFDYDERAIQRVLKNQLKQNDISIQHNDQLKEEQHLAFKLNDSTSQERFFRGDLKWFMIVMTAETLFPGYIIRANDLIDLASTVPPNMSLVQPSIRYSVQCSTFLLYLMIFISSILIHRAYGERLFSDLFVIFGAAAVGVGIPRLSFLILFRKS